MDSPRDETAGSRPADLASSRTTSTTSSTSNISQGHDSPIDDTWSKQKTADILDACKWKDIGRLRSLADAQGGFLTDELRRQAWPILLGLQPLSDGGDALTDAKGSAIRDNPTPPESQSQAESGDWKELPPHPDQDQVQLDVNRSFIYYPNNQSDAQLDQRKAELSALINEVLRRYPYLCYFQGYHDICQVFLLVLEPEWRARVVARLSVLRIRDFMLPSFGPTTAQLRLLPDILAAADPELRRHLAGVEPFYALAGTLTMYAHNIESYHDIARLFDVFLAREPVFSIYMFTQIILDRRDEIFEIDEPDMLHVVLGKVPRKMNLDQLIVRSVHLFERVPPDSLPSWSRISSSSSLKTARDVEACAKQTMEEGAEHFQKQVKELKWSEFQDRVKLALWTYRRPAKAIGVAVAVAVMAVYLRRHPTLLSHIRAFFS